MIKIIKPRYVLSTFAMVFFTSSFADGLITKEIYSFKAKNGTPVFTDQQPVKKSSYETHTIEAVNSTATTAVINTAEADYSTNVFSKNNLHISQPDKIIVEHRLGKYKKSKKKKNSLKRCQYYKKKLTYYSDKMKEGYRGSEYKKLEKNRKKYRNLLFDQCATKTFNE